MKQIISITLLLIAVSSAHQNNGLYGRGETELLCKALQGPSRFPRRESPPQIKGLNNATLRETVSRIRSSISPGNKSSDTSFYQHVVIGVAVNPWFYGILTGPREYYIGRIMQADYNAQTGELTAILSGNKPGTEIKRIFDREEIIYLAIAEDKVDIDAILHELEIFEDSQSGGNITRGTAVRSISASDEVRANYFRGKFSALSDEGQTKFFEQVMRIRTFFDVYEKGLNILIQNDRFRGTEYQALLTSLEGIKYRGQELDFTNAQIMEAARIAIGTIATDERLRNASLEEIQLHIDSYLKGQRLIADFRETEDRELFLSAIFKARWEIFDELDIGFQTFTLKSLQLPDIVLKVVPPIKHPKRKIRSGEIREKIISDVKKGYHFSKDPKLRGIASEAFWFDLSKKDIENMPASLKEMVADDAPFLIVQKRHRVIRELDYEAYFSLYKKMLRAGYMFADIFNNRQIGHSTLEPTNYVLLDHGSLRPKTPGLKGVEMEPYFDIYGWFAADADEVYPSMAKARKIHNNRVERFLKELNSISDIMEFEPTEAHALQANL